MSDSVVEQLLTVKKNGQELPEERLQGLEVDLDSTRPSMFVLRYASQASTPSFAIGDEIVVSEEKSSKTLIKGEVTSVEGAYKGGEKDFIVARGYDKSHRLHRQRKYRVFLQVKDSDLVSQLAGEAGLIPSADETAQVHQFIAQVNQTDWEFLSWRAAENGMVLSSSDGRLNFKDPSKMSQSPIATLDVDGSSQDAILRELRVRTSAPAVKTVEVRAWDMKTKQELVGTATVSSSDAAKIEDTPGALATKFGTVTHLSGRRSAEAAGDVNGLATAVAARFADSFVDAEAEVFGDPRFVPGALVKIVADASGPCAYNGTYRVTQAKHVVGWETGVRYKTRLRFTGLQDHSLLAMTNGSSPAATRVPRIEGVVPGIVTNLNDPDNNYRVKVKFPWLDDAVESDWMRTVQPAAGKNHGAIYLPEVGDEVMVAFEQGDFRRGYVIGGLYNGTDKPLAGLGEVVSGGKVNRRGYASSKGHRLIFDEEQDGKSGIHLLTGDDQLEIYMDKQNTKITVDCKNGKVEIHGAQDVSIKSDANVKIEATGNLEMKGTAGVKIESSATAEFKAAASMSIEGATTAVKGNASLDLKGGGMASLSGGIVKIN